MSGPPRDNELLARHVAAWKAATSAAPPHLEDRVLEALREQHPGAPATKPSDRMVVKLPQRARPAPDDTTPWYVPAAWPGPVWAAAGAVATALVIGTLLMVRVTAVAPGPSRADRLLVAAALREAETAEREHARAIARLQELAAPVLARVRDPQLSGEHAAHLMALAERLRFLDATIAEIDGFLQNNPSHSGARTSLLAAYSEKTAVLRDVIALDEEITS